jgi:hypothetical protein
MKAIKMFDDTFVTEKEVNIEMLCNLIKEKFPEKEPELQRGDEVTYLTIYGDIDIATQYDNRELIVEDYWVIVESVELV